MFQKQVDYPLFRHPNPDYSEMQPFLFNTFCFVLYDVYCTKLSVA